MPCPPPPGCCGAVFLILRKLRSWKKSTCGFSFVIFVIDGNQTQTQIDVNRTSVYVNWCKSNVVWRKTILN